MQIQPPTPPVVVSPPRINVPAWQSFDFICLSPDGRWLNAVFKTDGSAVEADSRFRVSQINDSYIRVVAPDGLPDTDDLQIEYAPIFEFFPGFFEYWLSIVFIFTI